MKYGALRIIASVFKYLAWIILILGLIQAIFLGGSAPRIIFSIIIAILSFLVLLAAGQLIYLFLDIEQNTRETAERLKQGDIDKLP